MKVGARCNHRVTHTLSNSMVVTELFNTDVRDFGAKKSARFLVNEFLSIIFESLKVEAVNILVAISWKIFPIGVRPVSPTSVTEP